MTEHLMVDDWPQAADDSTRARFFVCACGFRGFDWSAHVALRAQFGKPDIFAATYEAI